MVVLEDGVVVREELVVRRLEETEVSLELLCFPTSAAVLKPDSNLPRLKTKLVGKLSLALWLQLVLRLEAFLQQMHLRQKSLIIKDNSVQIVCGFTGNKKNMRKPVGK